MAHFYNIIARTDLHEKILVISVVLSRHISENIFCAVSGPRVSEPDSE